MHLIQGNLDPATAMITSALASIAVGVACYRVRGQISKKELPALLGLAGFVFMAQMLNFSTGMGFSCHLIGASLLVMLFSPYVAMLSMSAILTLQVWLLGDGSWSTLGANFLSMGVVAPWAAYALLHCLRGRSLSKASVGRSAALAFASFGSIVAASLSLHLMIGGALLDMLSMAAVWGLLEAVIAVSVYVISARKENNGHASEKPFGRMALRPLIITACVTLCLVPFSSQQPDGLEFQLATLGSEIK